MHCAMLVKMSVCKDLWPLLGRAKPLRDLHKSKSCRMLFCISGDLPYSIGLCHAMVVSSIL